MNAVTKICSVWMSLALSVLVVAAADSSWQPWDALIGDSWVGPSTINMYSVNSDESYVVRFNDARGDNVASGMKAFRFSLSQDGASTGHLLSTSSSDSFFVCNFSGIDDAKGHDYSTFLLLVAIDANELPNDFVVSLNVPESDQGTIILTGPDFAYYDHPDYDTGRPSGYYSVTDPSREALGYSFDSSDYCYAFDSNSPRNAIEKGMVTVVVFSGVLLRSAGGFVQVNYQFEYLPATAVFSVYGYRDDLIRHTNRAVIDNNDDSLPVSTFEVMPIAGDFDGDADVDMTDWAVFSGFWLGGECSGTQLCTLADFDQDGSVTFFDYAVLARLWQVNCE